jgi:hypothetical protein
MKRRRENSFVVRMGCVLLVLILSLALVGNAKKQESDVVAHEWGTFTSIAGNAGAAVQWYPWAVPSDLPQFIGNGDLRLENHSGLPVAMLMMFVRLKQPYAPLVAQVRTEFR